MGDGRIRDAVIVAAGRSSRLYPRTRNISKTLLPVDGRMPMLLRSVRSLQARGVERITTVVGYQQAMVRDVLGDEVTYRFNPFFAECNNLGSLWFARDAVAGRDFCYLHGDVIYDPELLDGMLRLGDSPAVRLLVDFGPTDAEAMKVRVSGGLFRESSKQIDPEEAAGEWTGIAAFVGGITLRLFEEVEAVLGEGHLNAYDTAAFNRLALAGLQFELHETGDRDWREIDDMEDLAAAERTFAGKPFEPTPAGG